MFLEASLEDSKVLVPSTTSQWDFWILQKIRSAAQTRLEIIFTNQNHFQDFWGLITRSRSKKPTLRYKGTAQRLHDFNFTLQHYYPQFNINHSTRGIVWVGKPRIDENRVWRLMSSTSVVLNIFSACVNHRPYFRHLTEKKYSKNPLTSRQGNWKFKNANSFPGFRTDSCGTLSPKWIIWQLVVWLDDETMKR